MGSPIQTDIFVQRPASSTSNMIVLIVSLFVHTQAFAFAGRSCNIPGLGLRPEGMYQKGKQWGQWGMPEIKSSTYYICECTPTGCNFSTTEQPPLSGVAKYSGYPIFQFQARTLWVRRLMSMDHISLLSYHISNS